MTFISGDVTDWTISANTVFPEKGDMFIFPAKLRHMVYPFKSKVERVSVSGNLSYIWFYLKEYLIKTFYLQATHQ